jgi:hypothetical protein
MERSKLSRCAFCRFFDRLTPDESGSPISYSGACRVRAPRANTRSSGIENQAAWPIVHESDWCGEYRYLVPQENP